jgi:hypothetical protein
LQARSLVAWRPPPAALLVLLAAALPAATEQAPPVRGQEWRLDVVRLKTGEALHGLVLGQTPAAVRLKSVTRRPGAPTVVITLEVPTAEVERVELLPEAERDRLRQRLDALRRERRVLIEHLRSLEPGAPRAGEVLDLRRVPWVGDGRTPALEYRGAYFRLVSNARREVVELAAIRLEQVYAAYARYLPPRAQGKPTDIVLAGSRADYRDLLRGRGLDLANPAFFDPDRNQIVCASDLERLAGEWQRAREHHERLSAQLARREAELKAAYKGAVPPEVRAPLDEARRRIRATEAHNADAFHQASRRLFERLYHEAFHAYLAGFVYPPERTAVPRWLNEGLAQVFETALVEAGELRVGHADARRLEAVRRQLAGGTLVSVVELLRSGPGQFQVAHGGDRQASDRHYLASWALAFYLTFERRLLGSAALDEYVRALHRGAEPVGAFAALTGQPLAEFEQRFHDYLRHLRPDGTAGR